VSDREFWTLIIQALLLAIDAIERWRGIVPRTKEYRDAGKRLLRERNL
jgi:hypothetical protein